MEPLSMEVIYFEKMFSMEPLSVEVIYFEKLFSMEPLSSEVTYSGDPKTGIIRNPDFFVIHIWRVLV